MRSTRIALLCGCLLLAPAMDALTASPEPEVSGARYFSLQPDLRLCPAPICGGVFVSLLNHRLTRCPDGERREVCHAAEVDWTRLGLDAAALADFESAVFAGRGLARGVLRPARAGGGFEDLGRFVATEAWIAASDRLPRGRFSRVSDRGLVCVTTPCFSLRQAILNTARRRDLSSLDLTRAGAGATALEAAREDLRTASILVAGWNRIRRDDGPAGDGLEVVASQFYLRVRPADAGPAATSRP